MDFRFNHRCPERAWGLTGSRRPSEIRLWIRLCAPGVRIRTRHGFSLVELLVVLGVTVLLTAIMFPAFRGVRESAQRLACSSNMRQIGLALTMYGDQNRGHLPTSAFSNVGGGSGAGGPRELVSATLGELATHYPNERNNGPWTGLAWLLSRAKCGGVLDSAAVFYSPSYRGLHTYDRYRDNYDFNAEQRILTNYHYCGHIEFNAGSGAKRRIDGDHKQVLLASGMRHPDEMNQKDGTNVLRGDCAVTWYSDTDKRLMDKVKEISVTPTVTHSAKFAEIWALLSETP